MLINSVEYKIQNFYPSTEIAIEWAKNSNGEMFPINGQGEYDKYRGKVFVELNEQDAEILYTYLESTAPNNQFNITFGAQTNTWSFHTYMLNGSLEEPVPLSLCANAFQSQP